MADVHGPAGADNIPPLLIDIQQTSHNSEAALRVVLANTRSLSTCAQLASVTPWLREAGQGPDFLHCVQHTPPHERQRAIQGILQRGAHAALCSPLFHALADLGDPTAMRQLCTQLECCTTPPVSAEVVVALLQASLRYTVSTTAQASPAHTPVRSFAAAVLPPRLDPYPGGAHWTSLPVPPSEMQARLRNAQCVAPCLDALPGIVLTAFARLLAYTARHPGYGKQCRHSGTVGSVITLDGVSTPSLGSTHRLLRSALTAAQIINVPYGVAPQVAWQRLLQALPPLGCITPDVYLRLAVHGVAPALLAEQLSMQDVCYCLAHASAARLRDTAVDCLVDRVVAHDTTRDPMFAPSHAARILCNQLSRGVQLHEWLVLELCPRSSLLDAMLTRVFLHGGGADAFVWLHALASGTSELVAEAADMLRAGRGPKKTALSYFVTELEKRGLHDVAHVLLADCKQGNPRCNG